MATTASADDKLSRIRSVSDGALDELLSRIRLSLDAETAAVLLLEPGGRELLATASDGTDREARVRLGEGFLGRIAATRQPGVLGSRVGVPLLVDGELLGVLHVSGGVPRQYTEDDVEFLQLAADRVTLAVHARQVQAARAAATALQHSLLPARLPDVPSLDFAARYVPGGLSNFAGDWYDVFPLPNGWLGIVIGDVVGHDLPAAVVMGRLRSALRAYSLETTNPADVLTRLDRKAQHFEPGMMATVLYGTLEPNFDRLNLSSAGHLAPMLARSGGQADFADLTIDPPIGAVRDARRHSVSIELPPGMLVCLYTDGLVERRRKPIDEGLEQLRSTVTARSAEDVCAVAMATLIGDSVPEDDVALLVFRRGDDVGPLEVRRPAVPEALKDIRSAMRRWLSSAEIGGDMAADLVLAAGEACTNAVEHAYGPAGGEVYLRMELNDGEVVITVRDNGRWRSPRGRNRGRGLTLMRECGEVEVDRGDDGTSVIIRRRLEPEATL
ncbi:ATP-binding SpoIIE family protein phosphatase [Amycolatopsis pithecellobii]|uniref:SpoIIE family protein phosphatase n=1 Tax=Amycolatopsis pithecellobii TaxID=664692 RepID=A0A6N7ZCD0_9PSEU|nr:SpoIIE family protein phosphatase [Amycolatopsis pithecellobii]MTD59451.1 SpoIIE family protein phosphatase [Amycolatopsis pithecellobii]